MAAVKFSTLPSPTTLPNITQTSLQKLNWKVIGCFAAALVVVLAYAAVKISQSLYLRDAKNKLAEGIDLAPDPYYRGLKLDPKDLKELHAFYKDNGILEDERKSIVVEDLNSLGLGDLSRSANLRMLKDRINIFNDGPVSDQTVTVKDVVEEVILRINREIKNASLSTALRQVRTIGFPTGNVDIFSMAFQWGDTNDNNVLIRVLDALVKNGHIFKRGEPGGRGIWIQA